MDLTELQDERFQSFLESTVLKKAGVYPQRNTGFFHFLYAMLICHLHHSGSLAILPLPASEAHIAPSTGTIGPKIVRLIAF